MATPVLSDYEYQLDEASSGGVLLNASVAGVGASLPFIDVTNVEGFDSGEFRTAQSQHEGIDGSWVDTDFVNQRVIVIDGTMYADPVNCETYCDGLKFNWRAQGVDRPLYFKHPGVNQRWVQGKPQGARYSIQSLRRTGQTPFQAQLICGDPYIYEGTGYVNNRAANTSGNLNPGGNHPSWPQLIVTGPCSSGWTVRNNTNGRILTGNFSIASSHFVSINMRTRVVMLDNSTSKRGGMSGQFWWLEPGINNSLQFTCSGSSGATNMQTNGFGTWH